MTEGIEQKWQLCLDCVKSSPYQPFAVSPATAFDQVYADYFIYNGQYYLVIGDWLSEWSNVFQSLSPHEIVQKD